MGRWQGIQKEKIFRDKFGKGPDIRLVSLKEVLGELGDNDTTELRGSGVDAAVERLPDGLVRRELDEDGEGVGAELLTALPVNHVGRAKEVVEDLGGSATGSSELNDRREGGRKGGRGQERGKRRGRAIERGRMGRGRTD